MHRILLLLIALLALLPAPSRANPVPDPDIPNGQEYRYRVKFVGGSEERPNEVPYARKITEQLTLVEYRLRIEQIDHQGRKAYKVIRSEKLKNGDLPTETMILLREPKGLIAVEARREHKDAKGRLCKSAFVDFQAPSLGYPRDIVYYITMLAAGGAVARLPKGTVINFPLYLGDLNLVEGHATSAGPENIKVDSRDIRALKIEVSAMLTSFLGDKFWVRPLQKFIPKMNFWYAADAPNYLIKFEGGFGGPGAPVEVDEIVK
jgi:hypothetical protein